MPDLAAVAVGFAVGVCVTAGAALALHQRRAGAMADAWRCNYRAECARHDATLAQLHALQTESEVAAARLVQLSGVALAQTRAQRGPMHHIAEAAAIRVWLN